MKNKIMLGLTALATCLSLTSCGESEEKKNNEMEEIAFSMASAKCDEYFEEKTEDFTTQYEKDVLIDKQLLARNIEENSSFYMWFRYIHIADRNFNHELKFIATASWEGKEVKIDKYRGYCF